MTIYIIAAVLFIIDQTIKFIIQRSIPVGHSLPVISNIFHITYVQNTGAAFGIMKGKNILFIVISLVALIGITLFPKHILRHTTSGKIAGGLILGGILSNLFDRLNVGYVVDFLDFQVWPVFNLADTGITIGAFLLIIQLLKTEK